MLPSVFKYSYLPIMAETQLISQLKFRVASLESALSDRQRELEDLRGVESQADSKIKAMTKIHNDKIKSLLNSIQILKKEKANLQGLSKEHNRSKLIQQLDREVLDQDIVIDVLRKFIYDEKGKEKGRQICDDIIVKALTKGPDRVRAKTREEYRIEIQKLKATNFNKVKPNSDAAPNKLRDDGEASEVSELSEQSFVNHNEEVFKKLRDLQTQNEGLKLEISTKGKIIQKLKSQAKEKDRLKAQVQLLTNQLQVSGRKIITFERLLRQTKQNMHAKISELYERQLKVEELEMNSKQNGERLKQAHESTNLLLEEIRQEKEQLQVEIELLKKQNEGLMLEKMSMKNRQDDQKRKIQQIREINTKNKEQLGTKLKHLQSQIEKITQQNTRLTELLRSAEMKYFKEREEWIEEKNRIIEEAEAGKVTQSRLELQKNTMQELDQLRKENRDLKELIQSGTAISSDNKILLQRLENYRIKLQLYESKGGKTKERQLYDQLFDKYNNILIEYEKIKKLVPNTGDKQKRKNIVEITAKQKDKLYDFSSGISDMGLEEVGSSILDNYDSSYDYELRVDEIDRRKVKGVPKISEEDKELLKLISSDLWCFVTDDRIEAKIEEALSASQKDEELQQEQLAQRIRKIKNLSHPQGTKLVVYDSELKDLDQMSENVSITSAIQKDIDRYDSDINIEVKRTIQGSPNVNMRQLRRVTDSFSSDVDVSSAKSGESSFAKKKKGEKATVIKVAKDTVSFGSSVGSRMNSSVSSVGVESSVLNGMDSDISVDFKKKKLNR